MENNNNLSLKFISFVELIDWSVQTLVNSNIKYSDQYQLAKIGLFLKKVRNHVNIEDKQTYRRVTVKTNNKGVTLRDTEQGVNIGTKKQFLASTGQFIISKIDARNGAFGIIPLELDGAIVTNDFPLFKIDDTKINPSFLVLITTTKEFVQFAQSCSSGTTNRQRMDIELFLHQKIPLPALSEQNELVNAYTTKIKEANDLMQEANDLEQSIEEYIFTTLRITVQKKKHKRKTSFSFIAYNILDKWGVENLLYQSQKPLFYTEFYEMKPLSQVVEINPTTNLNALDSNNAMSFIPMVCISDIRGEVIEYRNGNKVNSSGYTKFKDNDLLWARITPCMENGKSAIVKNMINGVGYGSTEYHVLRQKNENFLLEFLHILLRLDVLKKEATIHFTGSAGQKRVPKAFLENLLVPIPPLEIQNEIVQYIQAQKENIKHLRQSAAANRMSAMQEFEQAIFNT
jgi:type I restriction enzyme, S subunit